MEEWSGSVQPLHLHRDRKEVVSRPPIEVAGHLFEGVTEVSFEAAHRTCSLMASMSSG